MKLLKNYGILQTDSLIKAIKSWDKKVKGSEKTYADNFSKLRNLNADLLKL